MDTVTNTETAAETVAKKSIVPSKYSGKYKDGGSDALAEFIKAQCSGKDGFEFPAFFQLCKTNGVDATKVDHYEAQVAEKLHGAQGRARMTLRNMLATFARKNGKLIGLDGTEHAVSIAKAPLTGAAAKAKEAAENSTAEASTTETATSVEATGESDPE